MYPLHRWRAFADLTSDEQDALVSLGDREVTLRSGQALRNQDDPVSGLYLLIRGWVVSSLELRDGRRIIQKVHLPGDMLGTPSMTLTKAADTLTAITGAVVSFVPFERVAALYSKMPRLSGLFTFAAVAGAWAGQQPYTQRRPVADCWQRYMRSLACLAQRRIGYAEARSQRLDRRRPYKIIKILPAQLLVHVRFPYR